MLSNHHSICPPCLLLPSIFPRIKVFSNKLALCIREPMYWSFGFSNSPSSGYSGLISFRIDWFDPLAVQGTLKSLLQYHNWKAPILQPSAFFMVQLSYLYMTTGKTIALTIGIKRLPWEYSHGHTKISRERVKAPNLSWNLSLYFMQLLSIILLIKKIKTLAQAQKVGTSSASSWEELQSQC